MLNLFQYLTCYIIRDDGHLSGEIPKSIWDYLSATSFLQNSEGDTAVSYHIYSKN